ncbi:hypothetical protein AUL54_11520 [Bacillus sp. SDLI1]|nr:hypothetical protein AUL54_11520 [Bacillus sp. SDLI1]
MIRALLLPVIVQVPFISPEMVPLVLSRMVFGVLIVAVMFFPCLRNPLYDPVLSHLFFEKETAETIRSRHSFG